MYLAMASKRHVRKRACADKKAYDELEASRALGWHVSMGHGPMNKWHCSFCHKWHVGHLKLAEVEFPTRGKHKH